MTGQPPTDVESDLLRRARAWADDDPDPVTAEDLRALVDAAAADPSSEPPEEPPALGREEALADLADRFSGPLTFGTAGLRGRMGAGENRMNRAVVIRAAAGLLAWLRGRDGRAPRVVIGFDGRRDSDAMARDTAAVVTAGGGEALVLPRPLPTPVLAFATRHLQADAGVMVTASHNPPQDNGYKVYLGDGSQIIAPVDAEIAAHIAAVPSVAQTPRASHGWVTVPDDVVDAYLDAAVGILDPVGPRDVTTVHTALHGVGSQVLADAFARAGFPAPHQVSEQASPDPDFPTVVFPNPEEPGAMDAVLDLAHRHRPDLVLANDPDADRLALAVPTGEWDARADAPGYRVLRGDEVGALLGWYLADRGRLPADRPVLARSIVSSRLLARIADAARLDAVETLTGFKWIGRVPHLGYGYEEALGYCVDPAHVPDKDGITAALLAAELAAHLRAQRRSVLDVLDDLARRHGVHATDAFSVRVDDLARIDRITAALRADTPTSIAGTDVVDAADLRDGWHGLPPTDGLRYVLADDTRVIVRPSGTEPKLKVYLEVIEAVDADRGPDGLAVARDSAVRRLALVTEALRALTDVA